MHLEGLSSLQYLYLDGTQITDAGLVHLKGWSSLLYLNLVALQITDAGVVKLKEALPSCLIDH